MKVELVGTDRYDRTIAWVSCDGKSLNENLLKAGLAWHFKKYSSDKNLAELENKAHQTKAGLWIDPTAQSPWEFRRAGKKEVGT